MKTTMTIMMMLALTTFYGCRATSPRGGGIERAEGFKVQGPRFTPDIKQGETRIIEIHIDRGRRFREDVDLEFTAMNNGITLEPSSVTVRADERPEVPLRVTAASDAPLGRQYIRVRAVPATGDTTSVRFAVKVTN